MSTKAVYLLATKEFVMLIEDDSILNKRSDIGITHVLPPNDRSKPYVFDEKTQVWRGQKHIAYYDNKGMLQQTGLWDEDKEIPENATDVIPVEGSPYFVSFLEKWSVDPPTSPMTIVRTERNKRLAETDWTQLPYVFTEEKRAQWATYRQALRDFPENLSVPRVFADLQWPAKP